MIKVLFSALSLLACAAGASAETMGMPAVFPNAIATNADTPLSVTVAIPDSTLIPGGVDLIRLGAQPFVL